MSWNNKWELASYQWLMPSVYCFLTLTSMKQIFKLMDRLFFFNRVEGLRGGLHPNKGQYNLSCRLVLVILWCKCPPLPEDVYVLRP